jgi:hypothetical protein
MEFVNLIPYYLDGDVDTKIKIEMDNHIKTCESCKEKLNKRKKLIASFKYVLETEDINLKSKKSEIIKNINSSRYSTKKIPKLFYHLNTHKFFYTSTLAAVLLMFIILNFGGNLYNASIKYNYSTKAEDKALNSQSNSMITKEKNDMPIVQTQPTSTVIIKYDILSKEKLNQTGSGISPMVNSTYAQKLDSTLKKMKTLSPGVGPFRIIYCNNDKLMFYNYNHLVSYNYNEKEKGIYSILDFSNLKVGSYQGSLSIDFSFSPDGNYCLIGTFTSERDITYDKNLYMYNVNDGTVKEITTSFCMIKDNVKWYSSLASSSKWIVSAKDDRNTILWDVDKSKALEGLPTNIKEVKSNAGKYLNFDNLIVKDNKGMVTKLDAGNYSESWWFKDDNTLVGVPYRTDMENSKLSDFEVVEININDKTGKIVFRP